MKETIQYFSQKHVGLALLEPHAKYINKTCLNEEFDTVLSDSQTTTIKRTVLFGLVNNRFGLHILSCTPEVVDLIDAEVLNKAVEDEGTKGVSPLYLLSTNIEGRRIINKSQQIEKISKSGLNRIVDDGVHKGLSPLAWFFQIREGIEILSQHPHLPEIIDEKTLNRESISIVDDKYMSPALKLLTQRAGYELLLKYPEIASKIHENTINNMDISYMKWKSLLHCVVAHHEGRLVLLKNKVLVEKIHSEVLNVYCEKRNFAPIACLVTSDIGFEILRAYPQLLDKVSEKGLNSTFSLGIDDDGMSVIFALLVSPNAQSLLTHHLVDCIAEAGLQAKPEQGDYADISLKSYLELPETRAKWSGSDSVVGQYLYQRLSIRGLIDRSVDDIDGDLPKENILTSQSLLGNDVTVPHPRDMMQRKPD